MGYPKHSSSFSDVHEVLQFALVNNGAKYKLPDSGNAKHWRQRFYYVRKIMREEYASGNAGPIVTPYDNVILTVSPDDPSTVIISINKAKGVLTTLTGEAPAVAAVDPLLAEAEDFKNSLRGLDLKL